MQPEEQRHILPASQRFHAKVAPLRELVQVPCRALRQGGDTQVPRVSQTRCPACSNWLGHTAAPAGFGLMHALGMAFLLSTVMFCCQWV